MTCQLPSFETSWRFAIIMNHLDSQHHVTDVVHLLAYSVVSTMGGLVKKGHNDLRDSDARIADVAWGGVAIEPILVPEND